MLQPKRTKYRKMFKGRNDGLSWSGNAVSFGEFGLKATAHGQLTARQIEAARRSISRYVKRGGKMWIRVFPDKPITKKPIEVRMGAGKGNETGQEVHGVVHPFDDREVARDLLRSRAGRGSGSDHVREDVPTHDREVDGR